MRLLTIFFCVFTLTSCDYIKLQEKDAPTSEIIAIVNTYKLFKADLKDLSASESDILENIKTNIMPEILSKYPTVSPLYEGQNREAKKTTDSLGKVGWIVLGLIYIVIAFTFRSYSQPILLIVMIPFSMIGVIWGHYVHDFAIGILSFLGIIALIGIMVNDGFW